MTSGHLRSCSAACAASGLMTARQTEAQSPGPRLGFADSVPRSASGGSARSLFSELKPGARDEGPRAEGRVLIEATLVEAPVARPPQGEGEVSTKDPEASLTRHAWNSVLGFKAHVAIDVGSELIGDALLTGAEVGDSVVADRLIQGDAGVPLAAVVKEKAADSTLAARPWPKPASSMAWCIAATLCALAVPLIAEVEIAPQARRANAGSHQPDSSSSTALIATTTCGWRRTCARTAATHSASSSDPRPPQPDRGGGPAGRVRRPR